jgi:predicted lipid-binding transport protein (Tim44 family)
MKNLYRKLTPVLLVLVALLFAGGAVLTETADAKSKIGGKSFSSKSYSTPTQKAAPAQGAAAPKSGSFGRGLAGGLLGGALGGMLFGSMFGMGGSGMGILPLLLLGGVGYFLYRKFTAASRAGYSQQGGGYGGFPGQQQGPRPMNTDVLRDVPPPPPGAPMSVEEGIAEIRRNDANFDPAYFKEIASDVFFQVQAGWMRRDLDSYRHLLGDQLAGEYAEHFDDMRKRGVINKLESIAIRGVEICDAGCTGSEDFVTVRFTANLLDYTVNDTSGELVEGSMTSPVKFVEDWTWARPLRTDDWKLEGIKAANS